jgi:hypothetical protein
MPLYADDNPTKKKRAKLAAELHKEHVAPLSFLTDAVDASEGYFQQEGEAGTLFGKGKEAYVRQSYVEVSNKLIGMIEAKYKDAETAKRALLIILRGSSGVGKSTFLAYVLAKLMSKKRKNRLDNVAIFRASKSSKTTTGAVDANRVRCFISKNGSTILEGVFKDVDKHLEVALSDVEVIIMDGCSLGLDLCKFTGTVIIAASPSQYTRNLEREIFNTEKLMMPPLDGTEAVAMGLKLGVEKAIIQENFLHTSGITRYLFQSGAGKKHVDEAIEVVNASTICSMVSSQSASKGDNQVIVHSLVLWSVPKDVDGNFKYGASPVFSLVSRYVERMVSQKLVIVKETLTVLKEAQSNLAPLSGAEGYAGALFEAYAIRMLQNGGTFSMRRLNGGDTTETKELVVPKIAMEPIIVETNTLSEATVSFVSLRDLDEKGLQVGRLLWPTTTNFPTFDCFYIDESGDAWPMQMTTSTTHGLKNSGGLNVIQYFDKMLAKSKPAKYPAIFVVPEDKAARYQAQKFVGPPGGTPKKTGQPVNVESRRFEQWVMGI